MDFKQLLQKEFIILDGAMGTMLQQKGMPLGCVPEIMCLEHPEWLLDIHKQYITAGSDIIYTNTFGANSYKTKNCGYTVEQLISAAVGLAKQAVTELGTDTLVGLDVGPIGQLLEPTGTLSFEDAYELFAQQVRAGVAAGADLVAIETMTDLYEMKAALLAVKENCTLPVVCTMTFEQTGRTFTGCAVSAMALTLEGLGADAIGINCSLGPKELVPLIEELRQWTTLPIIAKPNAGLPDPNSDSYDITPAEFANNMAQLAKLGVKILGGCCGTNPNYITELKQGLQGYTYNKINVQIPAAVCSASKVVPINRVRIIGERINPTGKKLFKEALKNQDLDYILTQGLEQCQAGADILDVNVGLPEIDEQKMMVKVLKALQGVTDTPLQIDSSSPAVLTAALRVYNGKPIVNSVNGDDEVLDTVLPVVKKYGAAVVGLTLDKRGILKTAQERFEIAKKIVDRAISYGIRKEDVYIDCLTLTASAEQQAVMETLKAVRMVKENLGVKTVLGVSNISFGLPARELINQTFLTLAMGAGLDLPIINPNVTSMVAAIRAYSLLSCTDKNATEFVSLYGGITSPPPKTDPTQNQMELDYAIKSGLKADAARITAKLLQTVDPMELVNTKLIPPLDKAGVAFEKGDIFLPQLIQCAGAAQAAFEVIKSKMALNGATVSRGKIVLATVKGDIHDIGKNIVKILLENYGYTVIDLGKDVEPAAVADAVLEHEVPLVGLSALMTTTLGSMAQTIALLHERQLPCKVMVGGAVLTADYAAKIGADYYARDAKESVDIAKKLLG